MRRTKRLRPPAKKRKKRGGELRLAAVMKNRKLLKVKRKRKTSIVKRMAKVTKRLKKRVQKVPKEKKQAKAKTTDRRLMKDS